MSTRGRGPGVVSFSAAAWLAVLYALSVGLPEALRRHEEGRAGRPLRLREGGSEKAFLWLVYLGFIPILLPIFLVGDLGPYRTLGGGVPAVALAGAAALAIRFGWTQCHGFGRSRAPLDVVDGDRRPASAKATAPAWPMPDHPRSLARPSRQTSRPIC
jgi:hypothetical protein